jgi:hypothetical protein
VGNDFGSEPVDAQKEIDAQKENRTAVRWQPLFDAARDRTREKDR